MYHAKTENSFKGIKVSISMQEREIRTQTECGDDTVDRLSNCVTMRTQEPIVVS